MAGVGGAGRRGGIMGSDMVVEFFLRSKASGLFVHIIYSPHRELPLRTYLPIYLCVYIFRKEAAPQALYLA